MKFKNDQVYTELIIRPHFSEASHDVEYFSTMVRLACRKGPLHMADEPQSKW